MEFTAESIAVLVHGTVEGDPKAAVNSFAKIEEGRPGAISFLANPKYKHYIYDTKSTIVLVGNDFVAEKPVSATLIRVENPYETVAKLMRMASEAAVQHPTGIEQPSFISADVEVPNGAYVGAFAYIGKGAKLGDGVKIYPQAYIGAGVSVGKNTIIYPGVKIYHGCKIGNNCVIHAGAVIGADGFGFAPEADGTYSKIPQMGIVEIGDNVEIGANTTIDRAVMGATHVASGVKLDNLIQVAHNVEIGENTVMAAQVGIAGSAKVGERCMVGGQVGIAGHISIGNNVQIGAQSGIPKSIADGARVMGYPAVPAMDFARNVAMMKRLPSLFAKVDKLEKESSK